MPFNKSLCLSILMVIIFFQNPVWSLNDLQMEKIAEIIIQSSSNDNEATPAPSIKATLKNTVDLSGMTIRYYLLEIFDFPLQPKQKFVLGQLNTLNQYSKLYDVYVDINKNLVLKHPQQDCVLKNFMLAVGGTSAGESMDIILSTPDYKSGVSVHIEPKPIATSLPSGPTLSIELRSSDALTFELVGKGFNSNEKLKWLSRTEKVVRKFDLTADEQGSFSVMLKPDSTVKAANGRASVKIIRSNGEYLLLPYVWGNENLKHTIENDLSDFFIKDPFDINSEK